MLPLERRRRIIEEILAYKSVKVIDLSKEFGVTEETIRRDLEKLEQEGILMRTYGGAVLVKKTNEELPLSIRLRENIEGKKVMGEIISSLIEEGDVVMVGSGTTPLEFTRRLSLLNKITIITNSLGVISETVQNDDIGVLCVGGTLVRRIVAFVGPTAIQAINNHYVDKVILSCKAIDMEKGIMESSELEVDVKRAMVKAGKIIILAVDHTKFNHASMVKLFDFTAIDIVVTDLKPSKEWLKFFQQMNIKCFYGT